METDHNAPIEIGYLRTTNKTTFDGVSITEKNETKTQFEMRVKRHSIFQIALSLILALALGVAGNYIYDAIKRYEYINMDQNISTPR